MTTPNLLVLGGQEAGKSTYRAQLLHRLEEEKGLLRLAKSIKDRRTIDADAERVASGLQPMHTSRDVYHSVVFEIKDGADRTSTLEFPDYGGEQIKDIGTQNVIATHWADKVRNSGHWLLVLRIDEIRAAKSFFTDPLVTPKKIQSAEAEAGKEQMPVPTHSTLSNEFRAIEMLQRLLFTKGVSLRSPVASPRLCVLLSCWDQLAPADATRKPREVIKSRAPLLSNYLEANWQPHQLKILGLTSTERALPKEALR